jgi:hypothetical protein
LGGAIDHARKIGARIGRMGLQGGQHRHRAGRKAQQADPGRVHMPFARMGAQQADGGLRIGHRHGNRAGPRSFAASFHEGLPQRAKEAIKTVGQGDGAVFEDEHARAQRREALVTSSPSLSMARNWKPPPGTRITAGATCVGGRGEGMGSSSGRETL